MLELCFSPSKTVGFILLNSFLSKLIFKEKIHNVTYSNISKCEFLLL